MKKGIMIVTICVIIVFARSVAQEKHTHEEKPPTNLKVLPKHISGEELHHIMRSYCVSLGVRCGFCHAQGPKGADGKPTLDFASDEKPEKDIARKMIKMTAAINDKYLGKIKADHTMEQISCATCHMGNIKPLINPDSLKKAG